VTVKTRLGWDNDNIVILEVAKMLENAGVQALTVHCRTRSQAHDGNADWDWLSRIKDVTSIPVIGNGDIRSPQDVSRMLATGCDGVMIARAAIGNPWIFKQAKEYIASGAILEPPSLEERVDVCLQHLKLTVKLKGERFGIIPFRKYYAGYLKGFSRAAHLRTDLMKFTKVDQIEDRLYRYLEEYENLAVVS